MILLQCGKYNCNLIYKFIGLNLSYLDILSMNAFSCAYERFDKSNKDVDRITYVFKIPNNLPNIVKGKPRN